MIFVMSKAPFTAKS